MLAGVVVLSLLMFQEQAADSNVLPPIRTIGQIMLGNEKRGIVRSATSDPDLKHIYFHDPLFVLKEAPVFDGSTLTAQFLLSTPQKKAEAKDLIVKREVKYIAANNLNISQIEVRPFPLKWLRIDVVVRGSSLDRRVIGSELIGPNDLATDFLSVHFSIRPDDKGYLGNLRSDKLQFEFNGAYEAVDRKEATGISQSVARVEDIIKRSRASIGGQDQLIFQGYRTQLETEINREIRVNITSNSSDLLGVVNGMTTDFVKSLFTETQVSVASLDEVESQQLLEYLRPLLTNIKSENISSSEGKSSSGSNEGAAVEVGFKGFSMELNSADVDHLEEKTGVKFRKEENTTRLAPHSVKVYKLASLDQNVKRDAIFNVVLLGKLNNYTAPFGKTPFTLIDGAGDVGSGMVGTSVPLGTMLPFFGTEPPQGFYWADGKRNWPQQPWVPAHLRGKPIPNMAGLLVGGTDEAARVGQVFKEGSVTVGQDLGKGMAIIQSSEKTTGFKEGSIHNQPYIVRTNGKKKGQEENQILTHESGTPIYAKAVGVEGPKGGYAIPLDGPDNNPPHVQCRWIVRLE